MKLSNQQKTMLARIRDDREFFASQHWPDYGNGIEKLEAAGLLGRHAMRGQQITHVSLTKAGERLAKTLIKGITP